MSRRVNIAFVVLSVFVLLIAPFIPHHHHEGVACVVMERCKEDNRYNDEHTDHHQLPTDSHSNASCAENANYVAAKSGQINPFSVDDFNPALFLSLLISHYNLLLNADFDSKVALMYGDYIITYKSAEVIGSHALRAPPYLKA